MDEARRITARDMARCYLASGDAMGWFDALYAEADGDASLIPWADLEPNPNLVSWLNLHSPSLQGQNALKVGCGLGDDAEEFARRGFKTVAFDISQTAIRWGRRRYPDSPVSYVVADLFEAPTDWVGAFDFVIESYTLQVLPAALRREAAQRIASFVAPYGTLLVITRGRGTDDPEGSMPWPLTCKELAFFQSSGLSEVRFKDYMDNEDPPVRRFRVTYRRY